MAEETLTAILLSLQVAAWTVLLSLPAALPVAYLLARKAFPGKSLRGRPACTCPWSCRR